MHAQAVCTRLSLSPSPVRAWVQGYIWLSYTLISTPARQWCCTCYTTRLWSLYCSSTLLLLYIYTLDSYWSGTCRRWTHKIPYLSFFFSTIRSQIREMSNFFISWTSWPLTRSSNIHSLHYNMEEIISCTSCPLTRIYISISAHCMHNMRILPQALIFTVTC